VLLQDQHLFTGLGEHGRASQTTNTRADNNNIDRSFRKILLVAGFQDLIRQGCFGSLVHRRVGCRNTRENARRSERADAVVGGLTDKQEDKSIPKILRARSDGERNERIAKKIDTTTTARITM
jgi:hypothetical protein